MSSCAFIQRTRVGLAALMLCLSPLARAADESLLAHWSFDGGLGASAQDVSGNGFDASPRNTGPDCLVRTRGLSGDALLFSGQHFLSVPELKGLDGLRAFSISAWAMPTALEDYREIFRKEDGDQRVLFSFQHGGTVLSLGLNVEGYFECDAKVEPARVLDGRWHHCAATFDGEWARVYLDGKEIGSLRRPGRIAAGGPAPACIGSSGGTECFEGALDELRIHARALSADEIATLCAEGEYAADMDTSVPELAGEPALPHALIAHWTFNEAGPSARVLDATGNQDMTADAGKCLIRRQGVYGNALVLAGKHALRLERFGSDKIKEVTFSAWTRPTELGGHREIFRQDCADRMLFSFQEGGRILSFGLNVGGYAECDAAIEPARVLDGGWHHCAATFDGGWMRVYFDGREVGSLERKGDLSLDPDIAAFIGSCRGTNEYFQGRMDDLRVFSEALDGGEILGLYENGVGVLAQRLEQLDERLKAVYPDGATFAETCAGVREGTMDQPEWLGEDCVEALAARLRVDFPEDCARFTEWTGTSPLEYALNADDSFHRDKLAHLMDLLTEYEPVTESQWERQTPEARAKWEDADRIRAAYDKLVAAGDAARFSSDWVGLVMEVGSRIDFRPYMREPVAPYRTPSTSETRTLTAKEARAALEADWLHQVDGDPSPERIKQEIGWTRELADRIEAQQAGDDDFTRPMGALDALDRRAAVLTESDADLYFAVRRAKRAIAFANPVVDFDGMLLVDRAFPQGSEWPHETRHRLGYMAVPGGKIVILKGLHPGGEVRQLMPQAPLHGSFWRPDLSYDATKVVC
ncbi:MAG: LamG domain-containing protein, partial [bacterium]|nr:LamG domain-containing protein [bacterium]